MRKYVELLKQLGRDEEGTALLEYTILLGIVALAAITAAVAIGGWVGPRWTTFCNNLVGAGTCS